MWAAAGAAATAAGDFSRRDTRQSSLERAALRSSTTKACMNKNKEMFVWLFILKIHNLQASIFHSIPNILNEKQACMALAECKMISLDKNTLACMLDMTFLMSKLLSTVKVHRGLGTCNTDRTVSHQTSVGEGPTFA